MAILLAVGVMNLAAMALLAVVVLGEKVWRGGETVARIVGIALLVVAVLAPFHPWLLPGLRMAPTPIPMM
jgi:predicted metal-binding membrane protein